MTPINPMQTPQHRIGLALFLAAALPLPAAAQTLTGTKSDGSAFRREVHARAAFLYLENIGLTSVDLPHGLVDL